MDVIINETNPSKRLIEIEKQFKCFFSNGLHKMLVGVPSNLVDICPYILYSLLPNTTATAGFTPLLFDDGYELLGQKITNIHVMGGLIQGLGK